ncbi:thioesterase-like superfamily domain-containing protein [Ditylenchus destructor]|uniref:Thioesterase-like superfamily domain-containing protein n=1 Tax=Ditylenchus destructor TaxID=166010 RepID=A0AAD4N6T0_9BILA|nr:thioesterase-like superfamily domain-containing protein [Ditylenchus destructor]
MMDSEDKYNTLQSILNCFALQRIDKLNWRAEPPHFGGAVLKSRLFGGQIAAQIYAVSKQLSVHTTILNLDVSFIAPGNTLEPVLYRADTKSEKIFLVDAVQSQRLIARGVVRVDILFYLQCGYYCGFLHSTVWSTDECFSVAKWERNGNEETRIFSSIIHPTKIVCDRLNAQSEILSAASLRHQIRFESDEKINPLEYFLMESENEVISHNCALVKGRIFDDKGQLLLTFTQQSFISG